jgi:hypothetical protein
MKSLKKLPLVLTAVGLGAVSSFAEIKLTDNLSMTGFLDMSASGIAKDTGDATLGMSFDQLELDFLYKFGNLSARADINRYGSETITFEQGFITYSTGPLSFNFGRFLSTSGFEAAEPTGLFQYSVSKNLYNNLGSGGVYGGYQNGVSVGYTTPLFGLYGAVVSDLWSGLETEILNSPGFEGQVSVTPMEGLTAKVSALHQLYDDKVADLGDESQTFLNAWVSFAKGPLTVAAEYNHMLSWMIRDGSGAAVDEDQDGMGWLAMANYKITDNYAATVRYSGIVFPDLGEGDPDTEITFSPSVALTPNWLALAEVKYEIDAEWTSYAVESLFSF